MYANNFLLLQRKMKKKKRKKKLIKDDIYQKYTPGWARESCIQDQQLVRTQHHLRCLKSHKPLQSPMEKNNERMFFNKYNKCIMYINCRFNDAETLSFTHLQRNGRCRDSSGSRLYFDWLFAKNTHGNRINFFWCKISNGRLNLTTGLSCLSNLAK